MALKQPPALTALAIPDANDLLVVHDTDAGSAKKVDVGIFARKAMTTAAGGAADANYYSNPVIFTGDSGITKRSTYIYDIAATFFSTGEYNIAARIAVHVYDGVGGLSTDSEIKVLYTTGNAIAANSFKLVQATAGRGNPIGLWMQKLKNYGQFTFIEVGKDEVGGGFLADYNSGATWQAAAPTGAVVITSDLAGPWVAWTPILEGETTAGTGTYTTQVGRKRIVNGWCDFYLRIDWSAHSGTGFFRIAGLGEVSAAVAITGVTIGYDSNAVIYPVANIPNTSSFIRLYDGLSRQTVQSSGIIFINGRIPV